MSCYENDLLLEATELRLGLPGRSTNSAGHEEKQHSTTKRTSSESGSNDSPISSDVDSQHTNPPPRKAQIVGWPPVRSHRQNSLHAPSPNSSCHANAMYVKVSMDGAPYLRKIDLRLYKSYRYLVNSLETMFKCTIGEGSGCEYVVTYEDKDGDWMLAGDVPWEMFITSCKRIRVMKGSDAKGLGCI